MICPVCKTELGFELPDVEDFYYDCPVCNSSLSFHDGKCEVISQAEWPPKESQQSSPQNQSPLEANIIKPTPAELNSKVAEGEFDSEQLDRKQSHGEQVSVGKSNLEATDRGQLNREYEENPDDLDLNQPLNESEKMQSDAEQFNPENRSQTPFEESSYRGEDDRGESTPINQMERGQDEREQPLTDQGDFNEAPEVTEVPDIGEEPSEFIQSSKEELPQEDLAQEELLQQEPAQEEHSEEELQQEEPSFVFKEGIESEEPVKEDFSEVVEFSKKKEKKRTLPLPFVFNRDQLSSS